MAIPLFLQQAAPISRDQLRNQISQTIHDATQAAQQAAEAAAADGKATQVVQGEGFGQHRVVISSPNGRATTIQYDTPQIPPQVEPISIAFFAMIAIIVVGRPLARAIARRIDRGVAAAPAISPAVADQLQQISHAVDAIAIEVERISEGQRFTAKMLADRSSDLTTITPGSMSGQ